MICIFIYSLQSVNPVSYTHLYCMWCLESRVHGNCLLSHSHPISLCHILSLACLWGSRQPCCCWSRHYETLYKTVVHMCKMSKNFVSFTPRYLCTVHLEVNVQNLSQAYTRFHVLKLSTFLEIDRILSSISNTVLH